MLTRRTRISVEVADRGIQAATHAAGIVAPILGWDTAQTALEVQAYAERVNAERTSQNHEHDHQADATRRTAADLRHAT